jgi:hypothetical protein
MRVDPTTFDALMRRVSRQTTRRAALATLLGGAVLINVPDASAEHRQDHRHTELSKQSRNNSKVKPTWVWIENTGARTIFVTHGQRRDSRCCDIINHNVAIDPGARVPLAASYNGEGDATYAFLEVASRFWLVFGNVILQRPDVTASFDGHPDFGSRKPPRVCCGNRGTTVLLYKGMDVNQTVPITMDGQVFRVRRDPDMTNYKVFTVTLPATL